MAKEAPGESILQFMDSGRQALFVKEHPNAAATKLSSHEKYESYSTERL